MILVYYTLQMQSQTSLTYSQNSYQSQDVRFEQGMTKMYTLSMYYWGPSWSWSYGSLILSLTVQSVPITTEVVSSNPVHGEVYSIQHYVIKFCQWLVTDRRFSLGTMVSSSNKTDRHDITEVLLKVAFNIISLKQTINVLLF